MSDDDALRAGTEAHYRDPRYYDHFYRRRKDDVRFYADLAEEHGGPVLELGVGTGRVAIEIARRGLEVVGVDRNRGMLERAAERIGKAPDAVRGRIELRRGDMRRVRLGRRFALVVSPFNVWMHLYDRRDFEQACRTVREHLAPSGRLAFDVLVPDPGTLDRDPDKVYRCGHVTSPSDGRRYRYGENYRYDAVRQLQWITMTFQPEDDPSDLVATPLCHRQFFPADLEALLAYNALSIEHRWGDFERGPFDTDSDVQVIVARRRRGGAPRP